MESGPKLSKFDNGKEVDSTLLKSLIGSLRYLTCTRQDIIFAVGVVSCFMEDPTSTHLKVAKRILRYLKGTIELGLFYSSSDDFNLVGYCDSDYAGDLMIEKAYQVLCFSWVIVLFLGIQRNNQLLLSRLVKLNM